ncbi:MAG: hypothetical protein GXN99_02145, partial [Candidatus Nanohaloarchaeota archaeon]|nr:hypothetical protein [Candidatus Nanohaloarchaeota archaeon]
MDSKLLVFTGLIVAIIAVSGCTSGGGVSSSAGLVIDEFSITPKEIYDDNDYVDVDIVLRNAGSKDMPEDSKLWLYGASLTNTWQPRGEMVEAMNPSGLTVKT